MNNKRLQLALVGLILSGVVVIGGLIWIIIRSAPNNAPQAEFKPIGESLTLGAGSGQSDALITTQNDWKATHDWYKPIPWTKVGNYTFTVIPYQAPFQGMGYQIYVEEATATSTITRSFGFGAEAALRSFEKTVVATST